MTPLGLGCFCVSGAARPHHTAVLLDRAPHWLLCARLGGKETSTIPTQNPPAETLIPGVMRGRGGAFGRRPGQGRRVLMSGVSAFTEESADSCPVPSAMQKTGGGPAPDTESVGVLLLELPGSRTGRNECLLCKLPSGWHLCYRSLNKLGWF